MLKRLLATGRGRVAEWAEGSVNRRMFVTMAGVAFVTALVRVGALVKEAVVARHFGTSPVLDAFRIA